MAYVQVFLPLQSRPALGKCVDTVVCCDTPEVGFVAGVGFQQARIILCLREESGRRLGHCVIAS